MRYFLENENLKVEIESFGAELKSIVDKKTSQEYMWEADPAFWGKTSPVLFPFIGKLEGAGYRYQGKRYSIEKHGFARDMEFCPAEQKTDSITFFIESNEDTLKKFPFPFRLELSYCLEGKTVVESWKISNKGSETMYFNMGGHPAFACPPKSGEKEAGTKRTDCFVKLYSEVKDTVNSKEIDVSDGLLTGVSFPVETEGGMIRVTEHLFDKDALCLEQQGVHAIGLCDASGEEYVRLEADCPVWGIWSVPDSNASYICLEPWWGICDSQGYAGSIEERPHTNAVEAGNVWEQSFRIVIL